MADEDVGHVLPVETLPPFYFVFAAALLKPMVMVVLFGPPRPERKDESFMGKAKVLAKRCMQLGVCGLAALQLFSDFRKIFSLGAHLSPWQKVCATLLIMSASGNLGAGMSAWGLWVLMTQSLKWQEIHGAVHVEVQEAVGPISNCYVRCMMALGVSACFFLLLVTTPVIIIYPFVSFPMLALLWYFVNTVMQKRFPALLAKIKGPPKAETLVEMSMPEGEEECAELMKKFSDQNQELREGETWQGNYMAERTAYESTGVPTAGWGNYFLCGSAVAPFLAFVTAIAVRLYTGEGYWPALVKTVTERRFENYWQHITQSLEHVVLLVWLLL